MAEEVRRILDEGMVRDRDTGVVRRATAGDIAILFRSRTTHREFERELIARGIPTYVYKGLGFFDADEIKDLTSLLRYLADPGSDLRAAALLRSRFIRLSDAGVAALAPRLAAAIVEPLAATVWSSLNDADRQVLEHARAFVPGWLARVDRLPPSDLLDQILTETAYAYEIRGPRRLQAWENIKKMRGLVRRIQNRGYATLTRLAAHLDALSAGDESNAVLEAVNAVNLMTVHASKGLEFPVVFIVNLAKGAAPPPRPVRVVVSGEDESVSVGPFASDLDEWERERDKHETRRLLYVAMTRARDRLYLSTSLKDGALVPGRGSLADVLPSSLKRFFEHAASPLEGVTTLAWQGSSGATFHWRLCDAHPSTPDAPSRAPYPAQTFTPATGVHVAQTSRPASDFPGETASSTAIRRLSVTEWLDTAPRAAVSQAGAAGTSSSAALVGRLVHRMFQFGGRLLKDEVWSETSVRHLLTAEERASVVDCDAVTSGALKGWRAIRLRPEVAGALTSGELLHELPFSFVEAGESPLVLRGTLDCLVRRPDGSLMVLEFKTGRPTPAHERQLDVYVRAAKARFPEAAVEGRLVYV